MKSKGIRCFYIILAVAVLMVNPPVLQIVNRYCRSHPLIFDYPTLWVWLEFWYGVMILDFLAAATCLKEWDCRQDSTPILPVARDKV